MKNMAIINLGSHDIKIKDGMEGNIAEVFSKFEGIENIQNEGWIQKNFYKFTKELYEEYPKGIEYIEFPIVQATMEAIGEEIGDKEIGNILFILTKQKKTHPMDTIYLGKLFLEIYKDKKNPVRKTLKLNQVKEVDTYEINESPQDYDIMMEQYAKIAEIANKSKQVFMNITSGTQAMSMALVYNFSNIYKGKAIPLYTNKITGRSEMIQVTEDLKKNNIKNEMISFIRRGLYQAAEVTLSKYEFDNVEEVKKLIQAAESRIEFNFENARKIIKDIKAKYRNSRTVCTEYEDNILKLMGKNRIYLLNEVKNNAIYKYNNGAYTDFLGRVFRLQEEIYKTLLFNKGMIKFGKKEKVFLKSEKLTREQEDILNNIKNDDGKPLRYKEGELNIYSMSEIIKISVDKNSNEYEIYNECDKLTELKEKRNNSILAHGYEGTSKEYIDEKINDIGEFLNQLVNKLMKVCNEEYIDDKFYCNKDNEYNEYLIKAIKEL